MPSCKWIPCALLSLSLLDSYAQPRPSKRTIETSIATLRLNSATCDLVGVDWKQPALKIIDEPRLGENFRILLPKPGLEADYFNSRTQAVTRVETTADGAICHYSFLKNEHETVPLAVDYTIRAVEGQLQFSIAIDNPTDRKIAEVYYGILGGLQGIRSRSATETMVPGSITNLKPHLFTRFRDGARGGTRFGARYEVSGYMYPGQMPMTWMDAWNPKAGIGYYYADQDVDMRLTALYFEMRPYAKNAVRGEDWPAAGEVPPDVPMGLTMGWLNFPYTAKGRFTAGPVALQVHTGDWHTGSTIYRAWFDRHFHVKRPPTWLRKENAWQSIIISNPEDVVVHRFSELPKLAADAKKYGITTFEILGWDIGGIDRGYPLYTPNPRLGTPEEFRKALADIRAMGVHPLIFSNVQVVDTALPIFRDRFARFAVQGKWAKDWSTEGWGEGTMSARLGLTQSNMTMVSPRHPEFHNYLMKQYLGLVRDGADGLQLDKTHTNVLDFNPLLPTSPDKSIEAGILDIFHELLEKAHDIHPNFALAAENWTDRAFQYVDVSYVREPDIDLHSTALRYTFPEWTSTIFAEGPGDINVMNNGMRYGLVWDIAARHYNESADEKLMRPLSQYVAELIRIRKQYEDLLFLGRFNDTIGAQVTGDHALRYSVFNALDTANHDRAVVVVNYDDKPETATVNIPEASGQMVEISTPFEKTRTVTIPALVTVGPHRCTVIVLRHK
ncbi:MAG: hypothetical protein JSS87_10445 [Acidobacteria bacterium]|nr:hypothetical protein [Acidobacteriota bacterium]